GLFNLLEYHIINNLEDYVTGVEVGLDSNARKNRTGTTMENLVEDYLVEEGFKKGVSYFPQMKATDIHKFFGIDVTGLVEKKKAEKKFDFVVKTKNQVIAIEVNFYSGGGSKLNETARSYKTIAEESKSIEGFTFVWITDGKGWKNARRNLEETFTAHPYVFNIHDMESGLLKEALKEK
ncbi:MAG: DpnII family type II restriction endonuclease, partial [Bacilli bacterium]